MKIAEGTLEILQPQDIDCGIPCDVAFAAPGRWRFSMRRPNSAIFTRSDEGYFLWEFDDDTRGRIGLAEIGKIRY